MKRSMMGIVILPLVVILLISVQVFAHHGTGASYNMGKKLTLKGIVTEFRMKNPHCQLYFDVKDENGNIVHWSAEISSVYYLAKAGWKRDSIKPGDEVTVVLSPSKAGTPAGVMWEVRLPDGRVIERDDGREDSGGAQ
jgi:hypothetical protein